MTRGLVTPQRIPKVTVIPWNFATGTNGTAGAKTISSITGRVLLLEYGVYCKTGLAGASATIELGITGETAGLIAQATGTDLIAGEFWDDATPTSKILGALTNKAIGSDILLTIATAALTAGELEFFFRWIPFSTDGNLA